MTELYEHPLYKGLAVKWQVYHDLYEGDHNVLTGQAYLWPHELETGLTEDALRIRRIREVRSQYLNLVEPVISRYVSLFFRDEPTYDESVKTLFGDAFYDVNGEGQSLTTFIKEEVLEALLLYGRPIVLTDSFSNEFTTLAEQQAAKARPYWELLDALSVRDWQRNELGGYKFVRHEYDLVPPRASALIEPSLAQYSKIYNLETGGYTVTTYSQEDSKGQANKARWNQVSQETVAGWDELPIVGLEEESWIKDVAPLALKVFNLDSVLDNIHLFQAHQRIFLIGNLNDAQKKAVAEFTVGFLPEGSLVHTVEPVVTTSLEARRERAVMDLFKVAFNQNRSVAADSKQVEGADSQQEGKEQVIALVKSQTESLENLMNKAIQHWAQFSGVKNFDGKVHINAVETIEDLNQQIAIANAFRDDIANYPTWKKATLKKMAEAQNLAEIDDILKEIDATLVQGKDPNAEGAMRDRLKAAANG